MSTSQANKRGAGDGGIALSLHSGHRRPAAPDHERRSAMSLRAYKTSWLLWLVLWFGSLLGFWVLLPQAREAFSMLFAGQLRLHTRQCNVLEGLAMFSVVTGWLLQCALLIIFSWCRDETRTKR